MPIAYARSRLTYTIKKVQCQLAIRLMVLKRRLCRLYRLTVCGLDGLGQITQLGYVRFGINLSSLLNLEVCVLIPPIGLPLSKALKKLREKGRPQNVCHFGRGSFSTHHKENIEQRVRLSNELKHKGIDAGGQYEKIRGKCLIFHIYIRAKRASIQNICKYFLKEIGITKPFHPKKFGLIVKIEKCFHKGHLTIFSRMRHFSRSNVHLSFLDFLIVKNLQSRSVQSGSSNTKASCQFHNF